MIKITFFSEANYNLINKDYFFPKALIFIIQIKKVVNAIDN